jgi:hypothetical protein
MAVQYIVEIDQGADWFFNVTYEQPAGTPVNITGYTAALQLRSLPETPTAALSLATGGNGITITGLAGLVAVHATAAQTGAIISGDYYYDLEITSQAGVVTRLVQGQALVNPQVTR